MAHADPDDLARLCEDGFLVIPRLLGADTLAAIRAALAPHLAAAPGGRNDFEGFRTDRVYSLVARGRVFEDLVEHPRVLALCDALLAPNYLLTASQAICIHPGETAQDFHSDDGFYPMARPREAVSVATIWAVDDFTPENGATQVVRGSHRWGDGEVRALFEAIPFATAPRDARRPVQKPLVPPAWREAIVDVAMPAGSVVVFLGTLVHRGGENGSAVSRLALSNQYCEPWARQQENFTLSIPPPEVARMSPRVQALLGYSIHPPFMGHVRGLHPRRLLES